MDKRVLFVNKWAHSVVQWAHFVDKQAHFVNKWALFVNKWSIPVDKRDRSTKLTISVVDKSREGELNRVKGRVQKLDCCGFASHYPRGRNRFAEETKSIWIPYFQFEIRWYNGSIRRQRSAVSGVFVRLPGLRPGLFRCGRIGEEAVDAGYIINLEEVSV